MLHLSTLPQQQQITIKNDETNEVVKTQVFEQHVSSPVPPAVEQPTVTDVPATAIGLLEKVKNIFNKSVQKAIDAFLSIPLTVSVGLNKLVANQMSVSALVTLPGNVTCDLTVDFPGAPSQDVPKNHPLIEHLITNGTIPENVTNMTELMKLLHSLPTQQTRIDWSGEGKNAIITLQLPDHTRLTAKIAFPNKLDEVAKIKAFTDMIPAAASEIVPSVVGFLNDENFRFEWDGKTHQFALEFESRQAVKLSTFEYKESRFLQWLCKKIEVELPKKIAGHIDFATKKITFEKTEFKVGFGLISKTVGFESVAYDPVAKKINLKIDCFGEHEIAIPLDKPKSTTPSDVKSDIKVGLQFIKQPGRASYTQRLFEDTVPPASEAAKPDQFNAYFTQLTSTLRTFIPEKYMGVFDEAMKLTVDGRLVFHLGETKAVSVECKLPDDMTCQVALSLPNKNTALPEEFKLGEEIVELLRDKLKITPDGKYDFNEITSLLATLPRLKTTLKWNGAKGSATLSIDLPGGVLLDVQITAKKLIGTDKIPPALESIVSALPEKERQQIEKTLTNLYPLLSTDFVLDWNGENSQINLQLFDGLACKVDMKLPNGIASLGIDQIFEHLKEKERQQSVLARFPEFEAVEPESSIYFTMSLIEALPHVEAKLEWNGTKGSAILTIQIPEPDQAEFKITLDAKQLVGESVDGIPPALRAILAKTPKGEEMTKALANLQPLFSTDFALNWNGNNISLKLFDEISCKVDVELPRGIASLGLYEFFVQAMGQFKPEADGTYSVESITSLLATLPVADTRLQWNGAQGNAVLTIQLPEGAKINITLNAEQFMGTNVKGLPSMLQSVLDKMPNGKEIAKKLTNLQPFFSTNFVLDWNGTQTNLQLFDGVSCKVDLKLPDGISSLGLIPLLTHVKTHIKPVNGGYGVEAMVELARALPRVGTKLTWNGTQGHAIVTLKFEKGAELNVTLDMKELVGEGVNTIPPVLKSMLSKMEQGEKIEKTLLNLQPLLSKDFVVDWDDKSINLRLFDDISCKVDMELPDGITSLGLNAFLAQVKDKFKPEEDGSYSVDSIMSLITTLPKVQTELKWNGKEGNAFLTINLPEGAKINITLNAEQLSRGIPLTLQSILEKTPQGDEITNALINLQPLLSAQMDLRFTWNGNTPVLKVTLADGCELEAALFAGSMPALIKIIKESQPFIRSLEKMEFSQAGILSILKQLPGVDAEIQWDSQGNAATMTLTSVDDQKACKAMVTLKQEKTAVPKGAFPNAVQSILSKVPKSQSLQNLLALGLPLLSENIAFKWNSQDNSLKLDLIDGATCNIKMSLPEGSLAPTEGVKVHAELQKILRDILSAKVAGAKAEQILALLLTLPKAQTKVEWKGTAGKAQVNVTLPGGIVFDIALNLENFVGPKAVDLPETFGKLLAGMPENTGKAIAQLFHSFKPLLGTDFTFNWNGDTSEFDLNFAQQQELYIHSVQLPPELRSIQGLAGIIANDSALKMPQAIHGEVNLKDLSISFNPKITFKADLGLVSKEIDFEKIKYDADKKALELDFKCFGSRHVSISLNKNEAEAPKEKKENPKIDFEVRPIN